MAANIAAVLLSLDDGTDLADKINPRLVSLTLTEKRGDEADELQLTLHNHDGALVAPEPGRYLTLSLGWTSGNDVKVAVIAKGKFKVDEVEQSGPPDVVTIRARSADLTGDYRKRRTHTWKDTTLGAVLGEIAARNGITARIHPDLASQPIAAIEQHGKSDMAFVRDLGSRFDAVATWKNKLLVFMPIGAATTAGGQAIPTIALTRKDGWTWSFSRAERDDYDGAEATWHDPAKARRHTVKVGTGKRKRLKRVYATKDEAEQAAKAEAARRKRAAWKFEYDLTFADPSIQPNGKVSLSGWSQQIDGISWLVESVETSLDDSGLKQKLSLESA